MDVFNIKARKIKPKKTLLKHKLGTSAQKAPKMGTKFSMGNDSKLGFSAWF